MRLTYAYPAHARRCRQARLVRRRPRLAASCGCPSSRACARRSRACTAAGVDVVVVTSGAIARGVHLLELPVRPTEIAELQAASAVGQGRLYRTYDEPAARAGAPDRAGAADVLRHERAHALPQRAPHAADAARLARRARDQRERHDDDRRDLLRRQRLPRGAGRRAGRRGAAGAADRQRRPLHAPNPRVDPGARLVEEVTDPRRSTSSRSATSSRRWAPAGCARRCGGRDGHRGGHPHGDRERARRRARSRAPGRASASGTRFAPQAVRHSSFKLWLKYAKPTHGTVTRGRGRGAGAARGRDEPAAGRDRRRRGRVRRRRRGRGARGGRARRSARGSATTRRTSCAASWG